MAGKPATREVAMNELIYLKGHHLPTLIRGLPDEKCR